MCHLRLSEKNFPEKLEPSTHRSRKGEVARKNNGGPTDTLFNRAEGGLFRDLLRFTFNIGIIKNNIRVKNKNKTMERYLNKY
jgi:hypothetical protein